MKYLRIPASVALVLLVSACGGDTEVDVPTGTGTPEISAFTAAPNAVVPGETATLTWEVSDNSATLTIGAEDFRPVTVTGQASYAAQPTVTTTYVLIAENAAGNDEAEVVVTVREPVVAN